MVHSAQSGGKLAGFSSKNGAPYSMNLFPWTDPIPLPAPVWLFKGLDVLTLSLHFIAVKMFLGGLLTAILLNLLGSSNAQRQEAAKALAKRLPIVMTYVINLGIPPLLFAQVLYGPALYTANVLIGFFWFSVILLLMACYWLLYGFSDGVAAGKKPWFKGFASLFLAGIISRILSTNMALMLKPEVWRDMYSAAPLGNQIPPYDPTLNPRWLFMLCGALWVSGFWMVWIAGRKSVQEPLKLYLSGLGGKMAVLGILLQAVTYYLIISNQPDFVSSGLSANGFYSMVSFTYYPLALVILLFGLWTVVKKPRGPAAGYVAALMALLAVANWVILRDGIRDVTLAHKGFDVWSQPVVTNWLVVVTFLWVFVLGIGALAWLISVLMRSKPILEGGSHD